MRIALRRPTVAFAIASLLLASSLLLAATPKPTGPQVDARIVAPDHLTAGGETAIAVEMKLGDGWHTNSHTPTESYLIPTAVTLATAEGTLAPIRYPKGVLRSFEFSDEKLSVYAGTVRFETSLTLPADATGTVSMTGQLSFQACNEHQCFAPKKIPLALLRPVGAPSARK